MRRQRGDAQPTDPVGVVLLSAGHAFRPEAIECAVREANGATIAVVVIARIHGSAYGLPNPGLMPNAREKAAALSHVETAIKDIRKRGGRADGQVAIARSVVKIGAAVAKARDAKVVVLDEPDQPAWRRFVEGSTSASLSRRLRHQARVEHVAGI